MNDAEHGGDDAEGGHGVGDVLDRAGDRVMLFAMGLEVLVHQRFHLVMVVGAEGEETQIVAEEGDRVIVAPGRRDISGRASSHRGFSTCCSSTSAPLVFAILKTA